MDRRGQDAAQTPCAGYVRGVFGRLPRADQRRWAEAYLRGLLTTHGKKSLRRMAESARLSPTAWQSLQQFVNDSSWQWRPVRDDLADWVARRTPVRAWTLAPLVIPRGGHLSAGVHRRFDPVRGRTVNCQYALGLFLTTDAGDFSVDWQLYLPRRWTDEPRLRSRARIPEPAAHRSAVELSLDMVDRRSRTGFRPLPVLVGPDAQLDTTALVRGLDARGHLWIVALPEGTVCPAARRAGRRAVVSAVPVGGAAHGLLAPAAAPERTRLLVDENPTGVSRPGRTWLTNLPPERHEEALALIAAHSGPATGAAELDLGMADFAGRSYPGWHRNATLVSAALAHRGLGRPGDGGRATGDPGRLGPPPPRTGHE